MKTSELFSQLQRAHQKFTEALDFPIEEPYIEAAIQRFEYTFELSWKLMSSILKDEGLEEFGPKNVIRAAARIGLISEPQKWLDFANARNEASHIYKEEIALRVFHQSRKGFAEEVSALIDKSGRYCS